MIRTFLFLSNLLFLTMEKKILLLIILELAPLQKISAGYK